MTDATTLRIERAYRAPTQAVFDAWTSEEALRRWFHAEQGWETTKVDVDVRDSRAVATFASEIDAAHGGVDIVFSNHYARVMPTEAPAEDRGRVRRHVAATALRDPQLELAT
jgi:NAD(P)-dependent dehydrogenase (short-subunit alcohol dehydrogenase family)